MTTPTTYYAGGEDIDFTFTGSPANTTVTSLFRSAYARVAYACGTAAADPPAIRMTTPTFSATSSFWVHFQFAPNAGSNATTSNCQWLRLLDAGTCRLIVRGTGTAGQVKISTRNAASTITDLVTASSGAWLTSGVTGFDLQVSSYGASGTLNLYIGGVLVATFTGAIATDGATTLNQAEFSGPVSTNSPSMSEFIISSGDTRGKGLFLANSSSGGNADAWTGTLANVNKTLINDATFISSASAAQIQEYLLASAPAGTFSVDAVVMSARALVGTTGPQHFDFVTRLGGTDFLSADQAPTTSFSNIGPYIQATNPNTSAAWQLSDLTAAGVNYGVESKA